ncbi:MAG: DbpA RNA binding domain-containing protein, partial [Defluviitaleaceae bacterium]|nr:DbpA RNA binding domain-containing protein [Defluviitaleaceae bacterium]
RVVHKELTLPSTEQAYFELREHHKLEALCRLIDLEDPGLSLVFCNTKKLVDELVEQLQGRGYFAEGLHGDLKQPQRDLVMKKFRNRTLEILVATDVAARGLDVDDIDVVFNYDLPQDEEYYVHRIGRTGRAGKTGRAYTFVVGKEIYRLKDIMRFTNGKITRRKLPTLADIEEYKTKAFVDKIKAIVDEGHLAKYINVVEGMITEDYTAVDIAAALIKNSIYDSEAEEMDQELEADYEKSVAAKAAKPEKKSWRGGDADNGKAERLFISIGKKDKVKPSDLVGAIAGESGVSGKIIGHIEIYDEFSFVEVPKDAAKDIVAAMKGKKIKGKKINIERAKTYSGGEKKKRQ